MSLPTIYNFPDRYKNDGLIAFTITFTHDGTDEPLDLLGSSIKMEMRLDSWLGWTFSTSDNSLEILPNGVIKFNEIKSWNLRSGTYQYDLQITDSTGFVKTYLKGTWTIKLDITNYNG